MNHTSLPLPRVAALLCGLTAAVVLGACNGAEVPSGGGGSPTASTTVSPSTATVTSVPTEAPPTTEERLRGLVLSLLAPGSSEANQEALANIEVIAIPLAESGRDLWGAVSSGSGIWDIEGGDARHIVAVYERRSDDSLVEVSVLTLESEPTVADLELVAGVDDVVNLWLAIHGVTGAHSGTFELVRFDGSDLTSALWWFSPSPDAATIEDLDGDGVPEVVLNATDPYVYCYACGVRAWGEIIYRWVDGEPTAVNIAAVESDSQRVVDLTEQAALYANANLWRRARSTMQLAVLEAPNDPAVRWLQIAIDRSATLRLDDAGGEPQPLLTNVLAGEFDAAAAIMAAVTPAEAFSRTGPLLAGTQAVGWEDATGTYLVQYADAALAVEPTMASIYAVRALGRLLVDPEDWATALMDIEAALAIEPGNEFYRAADAYLLEQNGGARG
jgi:hypothetical protein